MSLGPTYVYCDDGNLYRISSEVITGEGWRIFLDDDSDTFRVLVHDRKKGEPWNRARPLIPPQQLADEIGIPIVVHHYLGTACRDGKTEALYSFRTTGPFPRKLLPESLVPRTSRKFTSGTYSFYHVSSEAAETLEDIK